ncbi:MAG TPA: hypothetical protein VNZ52_16905 [Candidatus Thermoplasmatota archaeon]|nr:hypothetical protein [Candidatus Thermoplasmatota archaeon]
MAAKKAAAGTSGEIVKALPADKAIFIKEDRPTMMYVGSRADKKEGWKKVTEIPADRVLKRLPTGMYVLAKK